MKPSLRFVIAFVSLFGLAAVSAAAMTGRPAVFVCEKDKCDGLGCVDSGTAELSCSISPGGSCLTSQCQPE